MKITLKQLEMLDACDRQRQLFAREFGQSVVVTRELCLKYADQFDWHWAARKLLSAAAWKIYDEASASAREIYAEATAAAWKIYAEACAVAFYDATQEKAGEQFPAQPR